MVQGWPQGREESVGKEKSSPSPLTQLFYLFVSPAFSIILVNEGFAEIMSSLAIIA